MKTDNVPLEPPLLVGEPELAGLLGVSTQTARRWIANGALHAVELPAGCTRKLYRRADVDALVAGLAPRP
jgi:excisionase family DNA binding protein